MFINLFAEQDIRYVIGPNCFRKSSEFSDDRFIKELLIGGFMPDYDYDNYGKDLTYYLLKLAAAVMLAVVLLLIAWIIKGVRFGQG